MRAGLSIAAAWALGAACLAAPAHAEAPSLIAPDDAFARALACADLEAAEAETAAALAESEARDGDGGRTAELAFNLAMARLDLRRQADAYAPAQRALAIAEARGEASGVDVLAARLAVTRAELVVRPGPEVESRMLRLLREAAARKPGDMDRFAYPAATWLADAAFKGGRYETALLASQIAERHAAGAAEPPGVALSRALLFQGSAHLYLDDRDEAYVLFHRAASAAAEFVSPTGEEVTDAERAMAQALAYRSIAHAFLLSRGRRVPDVPQPRGFVVPEGERTPCEVQLIPRPMARYPRLDDYRLRNGAVVVRFSTNAAGEVTRREIAAALPTPEFGEAVERVFDRWRVVRVDSSEPGCSMERTNILLSITFAIR